MRTSQDKKIARNKLADGAICSIINNSAVHGLSDFAGSVMYPEGGEMVKNLLSVKSNRARTAPIFAIFKLL